ncbi:MAG: aromatic amino acid lyase [Deltaproteobacteria bacterium]|nr:aromatic amino acid lyase [Deltaproteobacteria bacterium]
METDFVADKVPDLVPIDGVERAGTEFRAPLTVEISGDRLTVDSVAAVARNKSCVQLSQDPGLKEKISASRRLLEEKLQQGEIIYGVNTGFGGNVRFLIPPKDLERHQENLLQFMTCGCGPSLPDDTVRAAILLRANALTKGYSGVRQIVIEKLLDLLNHDIAPVVPRYGSVGASGDLIPSAYIGRVLLGHGKVHYKGRLVEAKEALEQSGIAPLHLQAKEGLALINGTTVMTGIGALVIHDGAYLSLLTLACSTLALEALLATDDPFREAIQAVKNHPGQLSAAQLCRGFLEGSGYVRNLDEIRDRIGRARQNSGGEIIRSEEAIQSPYSLRCVPQGIGAVLDGLREHRTTIEREMNSVNDNPLVDPAEGRIYHTGNFYGGHVARAMDSWKIDLTTLGNWLHALMAMLVDDRFSHGLPPNLAPNPGLSTGFKGMQICLTSLVCAMRQRANPSLIHTLPTEQYNQDMVSLGTHSASTAMEMTELLQDATAIVLLGLCQAIDLRGGGGPLGRGNRAIYEAVRDHVPFAEQDRPLDDDIYKVSKLIKTKAFDLPAF